MELQFKRDYLCRVSSAVQDVKIAKPCFILF